LRLSPGATARPSRRSIGQHPGNLFGIVLRIVRDRSVAEEVLQDVYLRIWQNASRFSLEAGQSMTWIGSIARHRAIDAVR